MRQHFLQIFKALFCYIFPSILSTPLFANTLSKAGYTAISYIDLVNVIINLVVVLGIFFAIMYGCRHFLKRYSHHKGQLKVIEKIHLGNRENLLVVEYLHHQNILLAVSPGNIRQINTIPTNKKKTEDKTLTKEAATALLAPDM